MQEPGGVTMPDILNVSLAVVSQVSYITYSLENTREFIIESK